MRSPAVAIESIEHPVAEESVALRRIIAPKRKLDGKQIKCCRDLLESFPCSNRVLVFAHYTVMKYCKNPPLSLSS